MEIIKGKLSYAKKVLVYGPEGIGKSTFASRFPDTLFIDTEGSTKELDVSRTPAPLSWAMLLQYIDYVLQNSHICRTLAIDTLDWAEQMCIKSICDKHGKSGIEDFGYGNGYVYVKEEFGRFLNKLSDVVDKAGINVVLTAHAQMRKFEQPDEMGAYDRWELKLGKKTTSQTAPLVKEWADMVLFANYKTFSVAVDDKGKRHKAQGGTRVMYTTHHPCWDAKNRYGLPEEMPFEYAGIAHIIEQSQNPADMIRNQEEQQPAEQKSQDTAAEIKTEAVTEKTACDIKIFTESNENSIPQALKELMYSNNVTEWDIQNVVAAKGYYPSTTPIEKYDPRFIQGVLVAAWSQVYAMIQQMNKNMEIPFN